MAKGNNPQQTDGSILNFGAQLWAVRTNLAIRGIDANLGPRSADSVRAGLHPDSKADFVPVGKDLITATRVSAKTILADPYHRSFGETEFHPPFNMSDWGGENLRPDVRSAAATSAVGQVELQRAELTK